MNHVNWLSWYVIVCSESDTYCRSISSNKNAIGDDFRCHSLFYSSDFSKVDHKLHGQKGISTDTSFSCDEQAYIGNPSKDVWFEADMALRDVEMSLQQNLLLKRTFVV